MLPLPLLLDFLGLPCGASLADGAFRADGRDGDFPLPLPPPPPPLLLLLGNVDDPPLSKKGCRRLGDGFGAELLLALPKLLVLVLAVPPPLRVQPARWPSSPDDAIRLRGDVPLPEEDVPLEVRGGDLTFDEALGGGVDLPTPKLLLLLALALLRLGLGTCPAGADTDRFIGDVAAESELEDDADRLRAPWLSNNALTDV